MIRIIYGPNTQGVKEVEVTPHKTDNLITFMKEFMKEKEKMNKRPGQGKDQKTKPSRPRSLKSAHQPPATSTKTKKPKNV
jgi:hypothetical protein